VPAWRPARAGAGIRIVNLPRRVGRARLISRPNETLRRAGGRNPRPHKRIPAPGRAESGLQRTRAPVDEATSPTLPRSRGRSSRYTLATRRLPPAETRRRSFDRPRGTRTLAAKRPRRLARRTARRRRPASTVTRRPAGKPRPVSFATVPGTPAAGRSITWLCPAASDSPPSVMTTAAAPSARTQSRQVAVAALPAAAGRIAKALQTLPWPARGGRFAEVRRR
jgi:hypothetical protein